MLKLQAEQPLGETRPCETRGLDKVAVLWLVPTLIFPAAPAHNSPSFTIFGNKHRCHTFLVASPEHRLAPPPLCFMAPGTPASLCHGPPEQLRSLFLAVTPSVSPTRGQGCPCHLHFTGAQCKAGYRDRAKSLLNRSFHLTPAVGRAKGRLSESLG